MGRPKKQKFVDGNADEGKIQPKTLDQIWGQTGLGVYGTFEASVYEAKLRELSLNDLKNEAISRQEYPIDDRERLIKRLMELFREHTKDFTPSPVNKSKVPPPVPEAILKILAEGR